MSVPAAIATQVAQAVAVIDEHLGSTLRAVYLFGSAVEGGLQPGSDIDLLVTVDARPGEAVRRALQMDLLGISASPDMADEHRPLEVTVVVHDDVVPWRYPARRELQFGEWLRQDLLAGEMEPALLDHDLAILLTKVRRNSIALVGPAAGGVFAPVPQQDLRRALADTIAQWNTPADWAGDERNVVLALARIAFTAETGGITSKNDAADWLLARLPEAHRGILRDARDAYLGGSAVLLDAGRIAAFVAHVKAMVLRSLQAGQPSPDSFT